jgi:hypothetical protein
MVYAHTREFLNVLMGVHGCVCTCASHSVAHRANVCLWECVHSQVCVCTCTSHTPCGTQGVYVHIDVHRYTCVHGCNVTDRPRQVAWCGDLRPPSAIHCQEQSCSPCRPVCLLTTLSLAQVQVASWFHYDAKRQLWSHN